MYRTRLGKATRDCSVSYLNTQSWYANVLGLEATCYAIIDKVWTVGTVSLHFVWWRNSP